MKKYHHLSILWILISGLWIMTSCSQAEFEYNSPHDCYFLFDNSLHQNALMASAMTAGSNIFVKISKGTEVVKGMATNYVYISTSDKKSSDKVAITTAVENYMSYELGAQNCLLFGYNVFDNKFVAFDAQCRSCYENGAKSELSWTDSSTEVKCNKCGRSYNLYNGTISKGEGGERLWEYRASCTAPFGILTITR